MKIQTITVRPEARIEELAQELINSAAARIVFAVGPEACALNQEINLRLLKFYAEEEDKEIGIQTANPQLKFLAERLAIPVLRAAELPRVRDASAIDPLRETLNQTAAAPEEDEAILSAPSVRPQHGLFIAVTAACFALVVAIWWFLQPTVVVTVYPKQKEITVRAQAQVHTAFTERQLIEGKIPGKIVAKEASLTVRSVTTGRRTVGVTAATGKITFINNSGQAIIVPKGSILHGRGNCRFTTARDILVPKKTAKTILGIPVGEEYGRVEVEITALEKGITGNQPAKAIRGIEGSLQRSLQVINLAPTMNGADREVAIVASEDVKRSETEARRQMVLAAPDDLAARVGPDYLFWPELVQTTMTSNQLQPEIGAESPNLTNRLDYRAEALVVSRVELRKYLAYIVTVKTPPHFRPVNRSLQLTAIRAQPAGDAGANLDIEAQASIRGVLDPQQVQRLIAGKDIAAAKEALTAQDEIADFQFNLRRPMTHLPRFPFQIEVILPEGIAPR